MPHPNPSFAVFGGIFDPIHNGHLAMAALARDHFGLSAVFIIPAGTPPHKSNRNAASSRHRLAMAKLAVRNCPGLVIRDDEIRRPGMSYTADTLVALREETSGRRIPFIIGSDNLAEISSWRRYRDILDMITLCVAVRPGFSLNPPAILANARIKTFPSPEWGISSTVIRTLLAKGYHCAGLLPDPVIRYIRRNRLYQK
jgi:nicotinate-nucleotide adenylyltransferase